MAAIFAAIFYFLKTWHQLYFNSNVPRTESTLKSLSYTLNTKHILHKYSSLKKHPILAVILATILNFSSTSMWSAWCRSEYLPATCLFKELTTPNYSYIHVQSIYFINLDRFQNKPYYVGHLSGHFEFPKAPMMQQNLDYLTL